MKSKLKMSPQPQCQDKCSEKTQEEMPQPISELDVNNELLNRAAREIEHLRETNRFMNARLTMFDTVVSLVKTDIHGKNYDDICGKDLVSQIKFHTSKKK